MGRRIVIFPRFVRELLDKHGVEAYGEESEAGTRLVVTSPRGCEGDVLMGLLEQLAELGGNEHPHLRLV